MKLRLLLIAGLVWCGVMTGTTVHGGQTSILIRNVNVFDGFSDKLALDRDVLIEGNPLNDVTILSDPDKNLRHIMKDGIIYKNTL